jgi:hypothetical protein
VGFRIQAAIALSVASAVTGLAKLRAASFGAKDAIEAVQNAVRKSSTLTDWSKKVRSASQSPLRTATGLGSKQKSVWKRGSEFLGAPSYDEKQRINDLLGQASVPIKPVNMKGVFGTGDSRRKHEREMLNIQIKQKRLLTTQARLHMQIGQQRGKNVGTAIKGLNAVSIASKEARGWWKILFKDMNKRSKPRGLKRIKHDVKQITSAVQESKREFSNFASIFAGALGALGGAKLLGGAGGIITRSLDLARAKEDARITFDTMLGSANQSEILLDRITKFSASTPFQRGDLIGASRALLTITGKNIDKNEELMRLASSVAALKPGTRVEDVGKAFVSASVGNFEGLKQFGMVMTADQFSKAGAKGGEAYATAVTDAVREKLFEKTGGRDLVAALSGSLSGLMSTFRDNIEFGLEGVGVAVVDRLGLKQLLADIIPQLNQFGRLVKFVLTGTGEFDFNKEKMTPAFMAIAFMLSDMVRRLAYIKDVGVDAFSKVFAWFNELPQGTQGNVFKVLGFVLSAVTAIGTVGPALLGTIALVTGLSAPISAAAAALGSFLGPIGVALLAVAAIGALAFNTVKREGDSTLDTFKRMWEILKYGANVVWVALTSAVNAFWPIVKNALLPAWDELSASFGYMLEVISPLIGSMFSTQTSMSDVENVARFLGHTVALLIRGFVWLTTSVVDLTSWFLKGFSPILKATASDIKVMGRALFDFVSGNRSALGTMRTLWLGFKDIITIPFREAIAQMFSMVADVSYDLADVIRPYSTTIAAAVDDAAALSQKAADEFREGYLSSRADLMSGGFKEVVEFQSSAQISLSQPISLDGEVIGENQSQINMRARNSGRGGDPMAPEDMGFTISEGRIRTVNTLEVLQNASGS